MRISIAKIMDLLIRSIAVECVNLWFLEYWYTIFKAFFSLGEISWVQQNLHSLKEHFEEKRIKLCQIIFIFESMYTKINKPAD